MRRYQDITLQVEDWVSTITISRPEKGNAFIMRTYKEIKEALEYCGNNPNVGAVVITGAGKNFSAGGDIADFQERIESGTYLVPDEVWEANEMTQAVRKCPKPVIAMVNGAAAGAGCSLALASDFRVVSSQSKLIFAFINMALPGDCGIMYFCMLHLGLSKTSELLMSGGTVDGEEAKRLGLAAILTEPEKLEEETYAFARKMAAKPLYAIKWQKEMLNRHFMKDMDAFTADEAQAIGECSRTEDFTEAVTAFLEKRKPQFQGW